MNLSLNAQDAMPDGGTLRVSAEVDEDSVIVSFADEGTGIDDESLDRIFDPFYSTKGPQHGTGLGLAICRSILEGLGGSIGASNANPPRHGAIFRVTLPRVESIANGAATHSANNTDNRTTSKTGH
jgi:signal transduction histidine kinase